MCSYMHAENACDVKLTVSRGKEDVANTKKTCHIVPANLTKDNSEDNFNIQDGLWSPPPNSVLPSDNNKRI